MNSEDKEFAAALVEALRPMVTVETVADARCLYKCQDCESLWFVEELINPIKDLEQRVAPGEPMPAGECPDCGALCHAKEDGDDTDEYTCRNKECGEKYDDGSDGYDGLCPSCADEQEHKLKGCKDCGWQAETMEDQDSRTTCPFCDGPLTLQYPGDDDDPPEPPHPPRIEILQWREWGDDDDSTSFRFTTGGERSFVRVLADEHGLDVNNENDGVGAIISLEDWSFLDGEVVKDEFSGRKFRINITEVAE